MQVWRFYLDDNLFYPDLMEREAGEGVDGI